MAIAPADPNSLALTNVTMARKSFARIDEAAPVPDLIQIQRDSFKWFKTEGLRELFNEISPIGDFTGRTMELELAVPGPDGEAGYEFGDPKLSEDECRLRDQTYAAPLRVRMRLRIKAGEAEGELKEQTIFMGDFPLMTDTARSSSTAPSGWSSASSCARRASTSTRARIRPAADRSRARS